MKVIGLKDYTAQNVPRGTELTHNMTDRNLLELAARAAGLDVRYAKGITHLHYSGFMRKTAKKTQSGFDIEARWNPLHNDADAFRLMAVLRISLEQDSSIEIDSFTFQGVTTGEYAQGVEAWVVKTGRVIKAQEVYGDDPCADTRRAIVQVAAQLA